MNTSQARIRVLVIDDSPFIRRNLPRILESDPEIMVVGTAADGAEGLQKILELRPDVVTLDIMMPVMDGLTALKQIMLQVPTPVVMLSSTTSDGARETIKALALGAVDYVTKPSGPTSLDIEKVSLELLEKVRAAYIGRIKVAAEADVARDKFRAITEELERGRPKPVKTPLTRARPGFAERAGGTTRPGGGKQLIAIAASTGGPAALQLLLPRLPAAVSAGLVIVQHISAGFTQALAERLNDLSQIRDKEAEDGEPITPGIALISPAETHLTVARRESGLVVRLIAEPANALHRPSADVLFDSIANCCAAETCAVILTGMGDDGALGLRAIREAGGHTIAQDEASSLIYGMPRRAVELNGVDVSLPLERIAAEIVAATS